MRLRLLFGCVALLGLSSCWDPVVGGQCSNGLTPCGKRCVPVGRCTGIDGGLDGEGLDDGTGEVGLDSEAIDASAAVDGAFPYDDDGDGLTSSPVDAEGDEVQAFHADSPLDVPDVPSSAKLDVSSVDTRKADSAPDSAFDAKDAAVDTPILVGDATLADARDGGRDVLVDAGEVRLLKDGASALDLSVERAHDSSDSNSDCLGCLDAADAADDTAQDGSSNPPEAGLDAPPIIDSETVDTLSAIDLFVPPVVVSQVSAGQYHTCALRSDGSVYCWGSNTSGQCTPPSTTLFSQIDSGDAFNCGIALDKSVACWGINDLSQGTPPAGQFLQLATGSHHACAIQPGGTVACWGYNAYGVCVPPAGNFVKISAGSLHTCGVQGSGTLACWGNNTYGQTSAPSGVFTSLSARRLHTCAVRDAGTVACWGSNTHGESTPPAGVFVQLASGFSNTCGIRDDGTVACWGDDSAGQSRPPSGTFLQLSAGYQHTCGVRSEGSVACWGSNSAGQSSPP